jgi:hypothetical protein
MTNVAVKKDVNAKLMIRTVLRSHPASWKAAGRVRAPVPTIRLKI